MNRLRVLSYNIHKGFSANNQKFVLKRMKESIELVHADLVFLQEVLGHHQGHASKIEDWPTVSQFEYLADRIWPHTAYGKNAVYSEGHHGNAILSKYPIQSWENLNISTNLLENRGLLHATLLLPHRRLFHVICLHLGLFESSRRAQVKSLCERIDSQVPGADPLIIAGDFNDWRERATPTLKSRLGLEEVFQTLHGGHARSFPSWLPALSLDRIYFRALRPVAAEILSDGIWSELSDHVAIYAEFLIP